MSKAVKLITPVTGNYSNEKLAERKEAKEILYSHEELTTAPPSWLPPSAKTEWQRIVPILSDEMPISELDYTLIVAYVCAYSRIMTAENDIKKFGTLVTVDNANGTKTRKPNPAVGIQSQATKDLKSISTSLGITLEARQRLALSKAKEAQPSDPFEKLLGDD